MEQDLSSKLSCGEQQASGDVNLAETPEPKSDSTGENVICKSEEKIAESQYPTTLQQGEGDNFITGVLSKLLTTLQISEHSDDKQWRTVQTWLHSIENSQPMKLKGSEPPDTTSCQENSTPAECEHVITVVESDLETQSNQQVVDKQPSLDNGQLAVNVQSVQQVHCTTTQSGDESSEEPENENLSVKEQCQTAESGSRTSLDSEIESVDSENSVIFNKVTPVDEKQPTCQYSSLEPIAEEDTVDQVPAVCFESGPILVFDLPVPSQGEEFGHAAIPPPILMLPRTDSVVDVTSASEPECTDVCLKHVSSILTCQCCYTLPINSLTVHMCKRGHQVCGHCFGAGYRVCPVCTKPLIATNASVERFLERLCQLFPKLFVTESKKINHSHRPIECPHQRCQRMVASNTGLLNHCRFEHSSVQLYRLHYSDSPTEFTLPAQCQGAITRAVAVLEVGVGDVGDKCCNSVVCLILSSTLAKYSMMAVWCAALYEGEPPLAYRLQTSTSAGAELAVTGDVTSLHSSQHVCQVLDSSPCLILSTEDLNRQCAVDNRHHLPVSVSFTLTSTERTHSGADIILLN